MNMALTKGMKEWLKVFVPLFALLTGFPLWNNTGFLLLMSATGSERLYGAGMWLDELYYSLPMSIFGDGWYPCREFGLEPSLKGIIAGAGVYTLLAVVLSLVICSGIGMYKGRRKV